MALKEAKVCPVCYEVYVNGISLRTGKGVLEACASAKEIKGAPGSDVTGLVMKNLAGDKQPYLKVIVLRGNQTEDRNNDDFPLSLQRWRNETRLPQEPCYPGVAMSGPYQAGFIPISEDPRKVLNNFTFYYSAGLIDVPLRRLWGGHNHYAKGTKEDLEKLREFIMSRRFPTDWNESVPFDKLHVSPNPFFD